MDFPTPNQSRDIEVHTFFLNGILGRNLCNLHSTGSKAHVSSLPEQRGVTEFSQQNWVYPIPNGPRRNP